MTTESAGPATPEEMAGLVAIKISDAFACGARGSVVAGRYLLLDTLLAARTTGDIWCEALTVNVQEAYDRYERLYPEVPPAEL